MEELDLLKPLQDPSPQHSSSSDLQRSELKNWIKENICKKEFCLFEKGDGRGDICKCGYQKTSKGVDTVDSWNRHNVPTDAFGVIRFGGSGQKTSKYVRVSTDTCPKVLYRLLTEKWNLSPPKLLISVTGGAKNFSLKPQLKTMFHRGITKVAQTTGAWILTGGTNAGVMKHVGLAVRDNALSSSTGSQIVAIGVATWGVIHKREPLVNAEGSFPAHYDVDTEGQGKLACLDNNHTHFLLVDDGTHEKYGVEIKLRSLLEEYISKKHLGDIESDLTIPVVCVVLGGGPGTLDTIYNAIKKNTPCVIFKGSGRIADVIAKVSGMTVAMVTINLIRPLLMKVFGKEYESFPDQKIKEWTTKIQDIIKKTHLLSVIRVSDDSPCEVDVAILRALLKVSRSSVQTLGMERRKRQLELAISWNRVDIAKTEIFTEESQWKSSDLHWAMRSALVGKRPQFVSLLLENGVNLRDFLQNEETLCDLYKKLPKGCFFRRKLPNQMKKSIVYKEVCHLLGGSIVCPATNMDKFDAARSKDEPDSKGPNSKSNNEAHRDPGRDLFLWAIVQNDKEMAKIAWEQCRDCVTAALGASKILKLMAEEEGDTDEAKRMQELAKYYEECAIGVFSECHNSDEVRAQKLLVRVSPLWGGTTCLRLAQEADNKNFVAQSGVQALLSQIWCGELSVDNPVWKVLLCMLLFPLIYTRFLKFRDAAKNEKMETVTGSTLRTDSPKTQINQRDTEINEKMTLEIETESTMTTNPGKTLNQLEPQDCWSKLVHLYTSPQVKFYWNIVFYFAFLFNFAVVLMMDFQTSPSARELLLYIWVFTLVCEEVRQLCHDPDEFELRKKAETYIKDVWNIVDVLFIILFIIGLGLRLTSVLFYAGKVVLCLDFVVFCIRLMAIFTISKTMGPKIIIVRRMVNDMFFFMLLLSIWVVAYGVAKQGILIDNDVRFDWIIRGAVYEPYLVIFGEFPSNIHYENFEMDACSINGTDPLKPKCPILDENNQLAFPQWLTIILLCVYLLFANLLLLNLLIAIFNFTFQKVQENTDIIWKFQRYELIKEYYSCPSFPPPLIIFSHLYWLISSIVQKKHPIVSNDFRKELSQIEDEELLSWEALMKNKYLESEQEQSQSMERRILNKVSIIDTRLGRLEEQVIQSTNAFKWIMEHLKSQELARKEIPVTTNGTMEPLSNSSQKDESSHVFSPVPEEKVSSEVSFRPGFSTSGDDGDQVDRPESGVVLVKYRNTGGGTAIRERGSLPKLGPNQNMEVVITRWQDSDRSVLEYLAVWDDRRGMFSLPSGPVNSADKLPETVMKTLEKKLFDLINTLLPEGTKGDVDDSRNTDNASVQNTVINIPLTRTSHVLAGINSMVVSSDGALKWKEVCGKTTLSSSQRESLQLVAAFHNIKF